MKLRSVCMFCMVGLLVVSSSWSRGHEQYSCSAELGKAVELYQKGRFSKAILALNEIKMQCGGGPVIDSVLYYIGMCNMGQKKYPEARAAFQDLARDYPNSPLSEEAQFRIGVSVYSESSAYYRDQKETKDAILLFKDFLANYPKSQMADSVSKYLEEAVDKLAKKEFENALFYEKNRQPESAAVYYKAFINEFPDSKYTTDAKFNMCKILINQNRAGEAKEILENLAQSTDSGIAARAKQMLKQIK
ncbi:MAG: outer membrane protein assembly factor BamD [Fibrobacter sp.]|nr:outer membrane protein assembly factor BamD [Fibrobacter sp.]